MSTNLPAFAHDSHRFSRSKDTAGSLTYEPDHGLSEKPFSLSADPRFLFRSPSHAPAFEQLLAGIKRREGLIVLTGEIGTGKTTLCRAVLGHLDRRTFSTFVPDPFVSREDLLKMLLVDFGVMSIDDIKSGRLRNASRPELSYPLYEFLNSLVPLQAFAVLVIDEAQNLPLTLLEEIRILSDLEGREKLLQVVLIGQPELRAKLKLPELRQVDQRVSVRCELAPLGRADVNDYVAWRLNIASGGPSVGVEFRPQALDLVYDVSRGVPRLINRICDRALHEGYTASVTAIDSDHVTSALKHLGMEDSLQDEAPVVDAPSAEESAEPIAPAAQLIVIPPVEALPVTGAVAEFASEAARPVRKGMSFPVRKPWRERIGRRPAPAAMLAAAGLVLGAATLAASSWYRIDPNTAAASEAFVPSAPARPHLTVAPGLKVAPPVTDAAPEVSPTTPARYIIQVASFEDDGRATRLVDELKGAGYRAYHTTFELDAETWWQVSVGPFATRTDGESALEKIRDIPGYEDATLRSLARQ